MGGDAGGAHVHADDVRTVPAPVPFKPTQQPEILSAESMMVLAAAAACALKHVALIRT